MVISVQGHGICAKALVRVDEWDRRIKGIQEKKGITYRGAEFRGFHFEIDTTQAGTTDFIYGSLESILD